MGEAGCFLAHLEQPPGVMTSLANAMPVPDWLLWACARCAAFDPMTAAPAGVFAVPLQIATSKYRQ
jgi:hypothetical protein